MNVRHPNGKGVLHSFSIKNIFYDKMELRLFHFVNFLSNPATVEQYNQVRKSMSNLLSLKNYVCE